MFGITFAAAELRKIFYTIRSPSGLRSMITEDQALTHPKSCKRFDTALREWIAFNHPNYRRYT